MTSRRARAAGAAMGTVILVAGAVAQADLLPPPPVCDGTLLGESCEVSATNPAGQFDGTCMQGADGAFYCRVGSDCYPTEPPNPREIAPEACPPEMPMADDGDEAGDEGCAIRPYSIETSSWCLLGAGPLALFALMLRRRRRRR